MTDGLLESVTGYFYGGAASTPVENVPEAERLERCIVHHLQLLFNQRAGALAHVPNYGLPDMSEIFILEKSKEQRSERLRVAIERAVKAFEPRLTDVEVTQPDDQKKATPDKTLDNQLTFLLKARIASSNDVKFKTTFALSAQASVDKFQPASS